MTEGNVLLPTGQRVMKSYFIRLVEMFNNRNEHRDNILDKHPVLTQDGRSATFNGRTMLFMVIS